jgi:hypothetical protein
MADAPASPGGSLSPADPLSPRLHVWLRAFVRGLKGLRMYAGNNETLQRYLDEVEREFRSLFDDVHEFTLVVREDRLLHRGDVVWADPDRMDGLPFILFRNAFRRLTFVRGMTAVELRQLMEAIVGEESRVDLAGEDLVTALWRLQLPHLRYITIDTLTVAAHQASSDREREEVERLQADVEAIVALVYQSEASSEDIVSGLSIGQEDLEALKEVRAESPEDLDLLDHATERAVIDIPAADRDTFAMGLGEEQGERLVGRTMDVLVRLLFTERSSRDAQGSLEMLQQLMDKLLVAQRFSLATELVRRLRDAAEDTHDFQKLHVARQLLQLFSRESRLLPLIVGLNDRVAARSVSELVGLLRALGAPAVPALMTSLAQVESSLHRRIFRDLIIELGVPDVATLEAAMSGMPGSVVRDLLVVAAHRPPGEIAHLVRDALVHDHPRVREQAVKMLRAYAPGPVDELLRDRLDDPDGEVRQTALRVAVLRGSPPCAERLRDLLSSSEGADHDLKELRQMTKALVTIEGEAAVPALARWLSPGLFASLKNPDLQVAAALALGFVGTDASRAALQKGSRSLVPKVREASRRSLERIERGGSHDGSDDSMDLPVHESGDFVPVTAPAAFSVPAADDGSGPTRIPAARTPIDDGRLPPAPPPESTTQVIERLDLSAILGPAEPDVPRADLTDDLLTEDVTRDYPPGSVRQYVPEIDVNVPRADRTPTPTGPGSSSGSGGDP